jgi:hypothetical protein
LWIFGMKPGLGFAACILAKWRASDGVIDPV